MICIWVFRCLRSWRDFASRVLSWSWVAARSDSIRSSRPVMLISNLVYHLANPNDVVTIVMIVIRAVTITAMGFSSFFKYRP